MNHRLRLASTTDHVYMSGQAVVAALHDVLRDAGEVDAGVLGHGGSLARAAPVAHRSTQA